MSAADTLDVFLDAFLVAVPDAMDVTIGRRVLNMGGERTYYWALDFSMPRRDKRFRVINGSDVLRANGETIEEAIENGIRYAHFHRTGTLPEVK